MTTGDGGGLRRSYLRTRDRVIHRAGCFAALEQMLDLLVLEDGSFFSH